MEITVNMSHQNLPVVTVGVVLLKMPFVGDCVVSAPRKRQATFASNAGVLVVFRKVLVVQNFQKNVWFKS